MISASGSSLSPQGLDHLKADVFPSEKHLCLLSHELRKLIICLDGITLCVFRLCD